MKYLFALLLIVPQLSFAQLTKQDSVWMPFRHLIGTWVGTGEGVDGKGTYERSYQLVLNKKYIEMRNKTVYAPTKENPKGYVHEDFGVISYDKVRKTFVLRQFHIEGFVNQYVLESISPDGKTIVFVTESIENIPKGWRCRETYTLNAANEFSEAFDMAGPDKNFEPYTHATFKRIK
ncbi:MAG TPA: hypothetical protein VF141_14955 [Chryseolinea sp.]